MDVDMDIYMETNTVMAIDTETDTDILYMSKEVKLFDFFQAKVL